MAKYNNGSGLRRWLTEHRLWCGKVDVASWVFLSISEFCDYWVRCSWWGSAPTPAHLSTLIQSHSLTGLEPLREWQQVREVTLRFLVRNVIFYLFFFLPFIVLYLSILFGELKFQTWMRTWIGIRYNPAHQQIRYHFVHKTFFWWRNPATLTVLSVP